MQATKTQATKAKKLPARSQVKIDDTWDLASLFKSDAEWEKAFAAWEKQIPKYEKFRGTLADGAAALAKCLTFDSDFDRTGERLGTYAHLKTAEDMAASDYQRMLGRYEHASTLAAEAASFRNGMTRDSSCAVENLRRSSKATASATSNFPETVRRNVLRCAPQPIFWPSSWAIRPHSII